MWNEPEELLAALLETVAESNRLFFIANTKKGTRAPEPLRVPRPGDRRSGPRPMSDPATVRAFFTGNGKVVTS